MKSKFPSVFDFDWRFINQDVPDAQQPNLDDAKWQAVDLPHDFAIYGPFVEKNGGGPEYGFRPLGIGWYRKSFVTPVGLDGKHLSLDFEGVYRDGKVWINGTFVAECPNGYRGFECDLTAYLKPAGQTNIIAVRADNSQRWTSRWYTGGGIYRHVWLNIRGETRIARHGVYVTTPTITPDAAQIKIETEIANGSGADETVTLVSEVLNPQGKVVGKVQSDLAIKKGENGTVSQEVKVAKPILWNLEHPELYRVVSSVKVGRRNSDQNETTFGIRDMQITTNGLFLNGQRVYAKGFCIHHDMGCIGSAAFDRAIERRLQTMKEIGCNAVRLSHNPHAPALLDLCDRMGILVFDEAFDKWDDQFYGVNGGFATHWETDLKEFIRRDQNHPSVFVWSLGNEVAQQGIGPDYGCNQYDAMAKVPPLLDPTRPVTAALYPSRKSGSRDKDADISEMALHMDVMSANYREAEFAKDRVKYPQLRFISSESCMSDSGRWPWILMDRDHAVGLFYWGGFSYIGESPGWPVKGWTGGWVDWAGFRLPSSWDLESLFSDKPMVHVVIKRPETTRVWNEVKISQSNLSDDWNCDPEKKEKLEVEALSNAEEVELFLNGQSLGCKKRQGEPAGAPRIIWWNVEYAPGTLLAVARNGDKEVARHEIKTAGAAKTLRLTPDQTKLRADGQDLAHVTVEVVDANGVRVPDATNLIHFTVTGAGVNAGVDNGDFVSDELFQADQRSAFKGRALLVVRAKRQPGEVVIKASADGFDSTSITLPVNKP